MGGNMQGKLTAKMLRHGKLVLTSVLNCVDTILQLSLYFVLFMTSGITVSEYVKCLYK